MESKSIIDKITAIALEYELESGVEFFKEFYFGRREGVENILIAFLQIFDGISSVFIKKLNDASNFYYYSLLGTDKLLDNDNVLVNKESLLLSFLLRERSMQLMYQLFDANSPYWQYFYKYFKEYTVAISTELKYSSVDSSYINQEIIETIYKGKSAMLKASITAMAIENNSIDSISQFEKSIDFYQIALALIDDLNDWKEDFKSNHFNYIISNTILNNGLNRNDKIDVKLIGKYLFFSGEAVKAIKLALSYISQANEELKIIYCPEWKATISKLEQKCLDLLVDIERLIEKELIINGFVAKNSKIVNSLALEIDYSLISHKEDIIKHCLEFIIDEWKYGYASIQVTNYFPEMADFKFDKRYYSGDVFQRAVITDILIDLNPHLNNSLLPLINHEIEFLLSKRFTNGWWNFYHDFKHQPCDADTTAQVMQILTKIGLRNEIDEYSSHSLDMFLKWQEDKNGGIGTWFLPPSSRCNELELLQRHFYSDYIGLNVDTAIDIEVMANLIYALFLFDPIKYSQIIKKGSIYIEKLQYMKGYWDKSWYSGHYYGIYVCMRLLNEIIPDSDANLKSLEFIQNTQNEDGGWGWYPNQSDPLNTAFAILSLNIIKEASINKYRNKIDNAINYLSNAIFDNVQLQRCSYISFQKKNSLSVSIKAITYAYVIKAISTI